MTQILDPERVLGTLKYWQYQESISFVTPPPPDSRPLSRQATFLLKFLPDPLRRSVARRSAAWARYSEFPKPYSHFQFNETSSEYLKCYCFISRCKYVLQALKLVVKDRKQASRKHFLEK